MADVELPKPIFVVSDGTGDTAESALSAVSPVPSDTTKMGFGSSTSAMTHPNGGMESAPLTGVLVVSDTP